MSICLNVCFAFCSDLDFGVRLILSATPEIIGAELRKGSWAREQISADLVSSTIKPITVQLLSDQAPAERFLIIPANVYCDPRLLATLCAKNSSAALIDSNPPELARDLVRNPCGPSLVDRDFFSALAPTAPFFEELKNKIDHRKIDLVDAATMNDYVVNMRRHVRPLCFTPSLEQDRRIAERVILDSAQKGTLDLPAYLHAPIESRIISLLCKTRITPNQITIAGFIIGAGATGAFALGRVGLGIIAALIFGLVDGLDGKQARVKIETTEHGKWEHHLDYLIENSWWAAIAFDLWRSSQLPNAFLFLALLIGSHLLDEFVKRRAKMATGYLLDDLTPFDRAFRLIAARRNVYAWILACGFLLNAFPQSYAVICGWAAICAAVHLVRSVWICYPRGRRVVDSQTRRRP